MPEEPADLDDLDEDDEAWDAAWQSGLAVSEESVFDIDAGWGVEEADLQPLDSPPRMTQMTRFDKQLRNGKTRKTDEPLTGRVSSSAPGRVTPAPAGVSPGPGALQLRWCCPAAAREPLKASP